MGSYISCEDLEELGISVKPLRYLENVIQFTGLGFSYIFMFIIFGLNFFHKLFYTNWVTIMTQLNRKRIIMDKKHGEPYLERYYIFLKQRNSFPFNIFIHRFLKSEPDDMHDHPWNYFTIILSGGYWEYEKKGDIIDKQWRSPGYFKYYNSKDIHRIELNPNRNNCWTLFIPFKKTRPWGFYVENGEKWVEANEYKNYCN